ncbi:hypothetical protein ACIBEA_05700 [Streptomyces sp. NPDC051555]|uniref:hypothetical protein n=1 Tax=Streptomyces sp. NPDC051555 TaxID=3365657 RepID=UPI0037B1F757
MSASRPDSPDLRSRSQTETSAPSMTSRRPFAPTMTAPGTGTPTSGQMASTS